MKKIVYTALLCIISSICFAKTDVTLLNFEKVGDGFYSQRNAITDTAADLINIESAILNYKKAFDADNANEKLMLKYGQAIDFKYRFLTGTAEEKKLKYAELLKEIESYGKNMTKTKEYNFLMALFWGRKGDYTANVLEAANEGVADKIKSYSETLYNIDKTFEGYASGLILGRLYYKAPYIVFILTWPDKNKSKEYLEEVLKANPEDPQAKYFLADTYWDLGNKETAIKLFKEAAAAQPRKEKWYYDVSVITECKNRIKELGIQ